MEGFRWEGGGSTAMEGVGWVGRGVWVAGPVRMRWYGAGDASKRSRMRMYAWQLMPISSIITL